MAAGQLPADDPLQRLGAAVATYVRAHATPTRLQRLPLGRAHRGALLELWDGFTADRGGRAPAYLQQARARGAYLLYYTPTTAATVAAALDLGAASGWQLPPASPGRPLRVLDLGAGTLGASLGVWLWLQRQRRGDDALEVLAVDASPQALQGGRAVLRGLAPAARVHTERGDLRDLRLYDALARGAAGPGGQGGLGTFDLVLWANVLNELPPAREGEVPVALRQVERALRQLLRPEGALLVVEPANRLASRGVIALRAGLRERDALRPVGPCPHAGDCPLASARDWCFFSLPWTRPDVVADADAATGHARLRLEASWLLLRPPDGRPTVPATSDRVIGGPMRHEGMIRRYLCRASGGRAVAVAPEIAAPSWLRSGERGLAVAATASTPARRGADGELEVPVHKAPSGGQR